MVACDFFWMWFQWSDHETFWTTFTPVFSVAHLWLHFSTKHKLRGFFLGWCLHIFSPPCLFLPLIVSSSSDLQLVKVWKFCSKCHSCLLTNRSSLGIPKGRASEGRTWRIFWSLVFNHRASGGKHGVLFRRCNETGGHLADVWEATFPDSEWNQSQRSACYVMEWSGITELSLE